ncbi:MAG: hypothetical protein GF315_13655 [candidate division Zixibacteria bacterium]|nr:hypothetical protein [candidate division Zixibacteria bacterium]
MRSSSEQQLCNLLHAYEIGALTDEDRERFEIHLLKCDACYSSVKEFKAHSDTMVRSELIKGTVSQGIAETEPKGSFEKLRRYLLPDVPVIFRPAFLYLLLLVVLIPLVISMIQMRGTNIESVQYQDLISTRSAKRTVLEKDLSNQATLTFFYPDARHNRNYRLIITHENGQVIYKDENYNMFNEYQTGAINLDIENLTPGRYNLTIKDPELGDQREENVYTFWIE